MDKSEAVKKGVETMKISKNEVTKKGNVYTQPASETKVLKAEDIKTLIENLHIQFNEFNRIASENNTKAIETRGAIAVAAAQLQGLEENDTKSTD